MDPETKQETHYVDLGGYVDPDIIRRAAMVIGFLSSQDYLKLLDMPKVLFLYNELDRFTSPLQERSVCAKGCAHCCKLQVDLMPIEARFIAYVSNAQIIPRKHRTPVDKSALGYCPFLDREKSICKIYRVRPFNCRAFFAFLSPDVCKAGGKNLTTGGPENGYGSPFILRLAKEMIQIEIGPVPGLVDNALTKEQAPKLKVKLEKRVGDIREFFGVTPL